MIVVLNAIATGGALIVCLICIGLYWVDTHD